MKKRKTHYPGARLKKLRQRLRMSQDKFAIELEVSQMTISNWENGVYPITLGYARLFLAMESKGCIDVANAEV